jgi:hypothetical protein
MKSEKQGNVLEANDMANLLLGISRAIDRSETINKALCKNEDTDILSMNITKIIETEVTECTD